MTFTLHRYLDLVVGFVVVIIGITGILLVFQYEFNQAAIAQ